MKLALWLTLASVALASTSAHATSICGLEKKDIDASWPDQAKWCATWNGDIVPGVKRNGKFLACQGAVPAGSYTIYRSVGCLRLDGTWAPEGKWGPLYEKVYGQPMPAGTTGSK
jgi:hypothetical protein